MAGNYLAGVEKVRIGVKALMDALPMLPVGSEISNAIMKAAQDVGKHLEGGMEGGNPQAAIQMLAMMARNAKANPQGGAALQNIMGGGGAGAPPPPAPGGAPMPPPPGGMNG